MVNIRDGGPEGDRFRDTTDSDIFHGMGGADEFTLRFRNQEPGAADEFYGDDGKDEFSVIFGIGVLEDISDGTIAKPVIDGGSGLDAAIFYVNGFRGGKIAEVFSMFQISSIENIEFVVSASTDVVGTGGDDWINASNQKGADILGGDGRDQLSAYSVSNKVVVRGQGGADILSGMAETRRDSVILLGGRGTDYFYFDSNLKIPQHDVRIADFQQGADKILVDIGTWYPLAFIDPDDGVNSLEKFHAHVDYDKATRDIRIDGRHAFTVVGASDLGASDFLFI